jgi:hypothetical protein
MSRQPILTLETLEPERPIIAIDGKPYELVVISDLGVIAQARLFRLISDTKDLAAELDGIKDDRVPELTLHRLEAVLEEATALVLRAPDEVRAKLSDQQKRRVLEAFRSTVETTTPRPTEKRRPRGPSTSAGSRGSSPASSATAHG